MQIVGEKGIGKFLKVFLQICFWAGIIMLISLPFILKLFGYNLGASMFVIYPNGIVSILFLGVSIALYIIAELMKQATEYKQENELTI